MATSTIRIKKVCEFCGKEFIAQKATTRYCSKTCNSRAYKYRLRVKKVQRVETEVKAAIETKPLNDIKHKALLTVQEAGVLIGITTRSVYNLIYTGALKATKLSSRMTLIRRSDVEAMLDANPYAKRHKREPAPITEFYTNDELREKFDINALVELKQCIFYLSDRPMIRKVDILHEGHCGDFARYSCEKSTGLFCVAS